MAFVFCSRIKGFPCVKDLRNSGRATGAREVLWLAQANLYHGQGVATLSVAQSRLLCESSSEIPGCLLCTCSKDTGCFCLLSLRTFFWRYHGYFLMFPIKSGKCARIRASTLSSPHIEVYMLKSVQKRPTCHFSPVQLH